MNKQGSDNNSKIAQLLRFKTRQQMAKELGLRSLKTFKAKLEQHGIKLPNGSISPKW